MNAVSLQIDEQNLSIACNAHDSHRLTDLAALLNTRLAAYPCEMEMSERLALAALSLLDETQTRAAALVRARGEIDRLTDLLLEARVNAAPLAVDEDRGRVAALRVG